MSRWTALPVLQTPIWPELQNCKFSNSLQDSLLQKVRDLEILGTLATLSILLQQANRLAQFFLYGMWESG